MEIYNVNDLTNNNLTNLPSLKKEVSEEISVRPILAFKKKVKSTPWYGKLISWWCKSPYYHVEIILNKKWISASPDENVYVRDIRNPLKPEWDYMILPEVKLNKHTYEAIENYAFAQHGVKYDMYSIVFSMVLPWDLNCANKWFCSELVVEILRLLGYKVLYDYQPNTVSPGKLFKILSILPEKEILTSNESIYIHL